MRSRRVVLLVAVIVAVALVGGCSGSSSKADSDLALQDQLVQMGAQLDAAQARAVAVERRFARERRAGEAALRKKRPAATPTPALLQAFGFTLDDLCARSDRSGDKQQRLPQRTFEHRRQQLLYYLNISCPSA